MGTLSQSFSPGPWKIPGTTWIYRASDLGMCPLCCTVKLRSARLSLFARANFRVETHTSSTSSRSVPAFFQARWITHLTAPDGCFRWDFYSRNDRTSGWMEGNATKQSGRREGLQDDGRQHSLDWATCQLRSCERL